MVTEEYAHRGARNRLCDVGSGLSARERREQVHAVGKWVGKRTDAEQ